MVVVVRLLARASRADTMLSRLVFRAPSANPLVRDSRAAAWEETSAAKKRLFIFLFFEKKGYFKQFSYFWLEISIKYRSFKKTQDKEMETFQESMSIIMSSQGMFLCSKKI